MIWQNNLSPARPRQRRGFTLTELLVVLAIIGLMASMLLSAVYQVQALAAEARTKSMIVKLNSRLMPLWESYRHRRVSPQGNVNLSDPGQRQVLAMNRIRAKYELQRMEMPNHWIDIIEQPVFLRQAPSVWQNYNAKLSNHNNPNFNAQSPNELFEDAECLFLILTMNVGADNLSGFDLADGSVGDRDNDGWPEFHDGYGQPIRFLRWPAGLVSDLQPGIPGGTNVTPTRNPQENPDPLNPMMLDVFNNQSSGQPWGFSMTPLICSMGPDENFGLQNYSHGPGTINNPYSTGQASIQVGTPTLTSQGNLANTHLDNIHNHELGVQ